MFAHGHFLNKFFNYVLHMVADTSVTVREATTHLFHHILHQLTP